MDGGGGRAWWGREVGWLAAGQRGTSHRGKTVHWDSLDTCRPRGLAGGREAVPASGGVWRLYVLCRVVMISRLEQRVCLCCPGKNVKVCEDFRVSQSGFSYLSAMPFRGVSG